LYLTIRYGEWLPVKTTAESNNKEMLEVKETTETTSHSLISPVMQCAFNYMLNSKAVILSTKGKQELEECWEGSSKEVWEIQAIWGYERVTICSETHSIFNEAPMDWFIWDIA
jgi:hypothetical protein